LRQLGEREVERARPSVAGGSVRPVAVVLAPAATSRAKRALDIGLALLVMPLVLPLGVLITLTVLATSRGSVLFGQERVGLGGRSFKMYKFRTMHREAEQLLAQDPHLWNEYVTNGFKLPAELDRRVTKVGRFLRRSSLDELPQILNVLLGSMSLVGPRPVVPAEIDNYGDRRDIYLSVRPGVTGAWQVSGRSHIDYPERVDIDEAYVRGWSLGLDIKILARTPGAVITARGAI
jgi:exopolysaccharide production protein ExoY